MCRHCGEPEGEHPDGLYESKAAPFDDISEELLSRILRWLPNRDDLTTDLAKALAPIIVDQMEAGAIACAIHYGLNPTWDAFNPGVAKWVNSYTVKLAGQIADTTIGRLSSELASGLEAGESLVDLKARVATAMGSDANDYRAEMIAATECCRANEAGQDRQAIDAGAVRKIWRTADDCCEFCSSLDGLTVEVDTNFFEKGDQITIGTGDEGQSQSLDYGETPYPPLHPWCRCDVEYEF